MKRTSRGFDIYTEFIDTYGARVRVQESSSAAGRRCWVFTSGGRTLGRRQRELFEACRAGGFKMPGDDVVTDHTSPHLTPAQARRLARALLRFAEGRR